MSANTGKPIDDRKVADEQFQRAGHPPESASCDHKHWSFNKHGRVCTCGTHMIDFGD